MVNEAARDAIWEALFGKARTRVFAVLDGAASPRILALLSRHDREHCCLFTGDMPPDLEQHAPHLAELSGEGELTRTLIADGWGKAWGIFALTGEDVTFRGLRKHFRTFLMVRKFDGKSLYFRYYDPRVFGQYLPTCNVIEAELVFGPVRSYVMESGGGAAISALARVDGLPYTRVVELPGGVGAATAAEKSSAVLR